MCLSAPKVSTPSVAMPAYDGREAIAQGRLEARLRRARAGAASTILTSPVGIPSRAPATAQLGRVN